MEARLRSWWQKIRKNPVAFVLIALFVAVSLLVIVGGYKFNWDWTGFNHPSKTLWDWLQLIAALAIPVVVGFGAVWFTTRQGKVADAENTDNQRETALQAYIDKMSELLLHENLRNSQPEAEVCNVARVRTITVLTQLNARRVGHVFTFLRETGLMSTASTSNVVSLKHANLRGVKWGQAELTKAILSGAILSEADLSGAFLSDADLSGVRLRDANLSGAHLNQINLSDANLIRANLSEADLSGANLSEANLSKADLSGAKVTEEQLKQAKSLEGATMPDGSKHS